MAQLGLGVSIVLDRAVNSRRLTQQDAGQLAAAIEAAGPQGVALVAA